MIAWLVKHRAPVYLMVVCVLIFGLGTYQLLPRESNPDVKVPVVMVATPYIGVAPKDIETLVTNPLENELSGVKDLKKMSSTSAEGVSLITLEFVPEVVIEDVLQKVRDRVNRVKPDLPADAEEPDVAEISFSDLPILILSIGGPVDEEQLKHLGEDLEDDIKQIPGVLSASLSGGRTRQIRVQVDPTRLDYYGLQFSDVLSAVSAENVNIPGGNVTTGNSNYLLRVPGEFSDPAEIAGVAIKRVGDRPVFVSDVATVVDGFEDRGTYARMNGAPSVSLAVSKRSGANILDIAEEVKAIADKHQKRWPEAVTYAVQGDQSKYVNDMVLDLENNIFSALVLVVGVLLFFMGARNSLFVAVAIPLSMLLGFVVIYVTGMTLNMVVLFSLILALGMLVDNAIVLVENIYRHHEEGADLKTAAIGATQEVAGAVIASTATTVAAFFPLVFWTGIMGQFMGFLPKTVIIVLVSSLVIALGVLPVLTSRLLRVKGRNPDGSRVGGAASSRDAGDEPYRQGAPPSSSARPVDEASLSPVLRGYTRFLAASIRHRYISATLVFGSLVGTFVAYGALNHGTEFFPSVEPDQASITVRAPDGTDLEATDRIVRQIEAILAEEKNVDTFVAETGVSGGGQDPMSSTQALSNAGRVTVDFLPHATKAKDDETPRIESTDVTIERLRGKLAAIVGAKITIGGVEMGPPVGPKISVEVSGKDFHAVGDVAARVRRELADIEGTTDLEDNYRVGRPEMRLRIDRGAAKRVGASTQAVATTVRTAVAGTEASKLRDGEDEYDIIVEVAPQYKDDLQAVLSMRIPGRLDTSPDTFPVPLSAVASYELTGGSGSIRHIDQDLVVTVTGDVADGFNENEVRQRVQQYIADKEMPAGFGLRLGGANDEQQSAVDFLSKAFLVAIFLIALVLVTQFNSFATPIIILGAVVLSLVGVLWGLIITGTPFGVIMTGLGVISLAGVVVNNAIVLLEYVEQLKEQGLATRDALIRAGLVRFRPVMLTAATTILGLVPMAVGVSFDVRNVAIVVGSQNALWWGPMAVAVIFGLLFATILTLVMVPTFYSILDDFRGFPQRVRERLGRRRPTTPAPAEQSPAE
ncbi:MAG: efflux RND transporter permease subunit [Myxococcota bacterium]